MDKVVTSYEAKTHLPEMLREVGLGYTFTITKHGVASGRLVGVEQVDSPPRTSLADRFAELAAKNGSMQGTTYQELRDEGRRY